MAATNLSPLINGQAYNWSSIKFALFGIPVIGITDIQYKRKQKKVNNYGAGMEPVSRGYGNIEYEGSIEMYLEEWKNIVAAAPNRDAMAIPSFDITVEYGDNLSAIEVDILRNVEFMEDPFEGKQDDPMLKVKIPLIIGRIER